MSEGQQPESMDGYEWKPQACPICEVGPTKFVGRRGGAAHRAGLGVECELWRCGECGLIFPNPMPVPGGGVEQHYDLDPDEYFQHHETGNKIAAGHQLLASAELWAGGKGRVLDIGSGRGELLSVAREDGWDAVGIEPSPQFADYAERNSGAPVRRVPVEECGFDDASFDVVILGAVLEHLYNPDETIREVARILRPGGALFVDVPNENGLYFRLGNLYQRFRGRDWSVNLAPTFEPYHVFGFNARSLRKLLSKHDLRVRHWHVYAGHAMLPNRPGMLGALEKLAAHGVTFASGVGGLGTYIETWAVRD